MLNVAKKQFQPRDDQGPRPQRRTRISTRPPVDPFAAKHDITMPMERQLQPCNGDTCHHGEKDKSSSNNDYPHHKKGRPQLAHAFKVAKWTHQQPTDRPTWVKITVTHRDDRRFKVQRLWKENKFSSDFCSFLSFALVTNCWICDVKMWFSKKIIIHSLVISHEECKRKPRKPVKKEKGKKPWNHSHPPEPN